MGGTSVFYYTQMKLLVVLFSLCLMEISGHHRFPPGRNFNKQPMSTFGRNHNRFHQQPIFRHQGNPGNYYGHPGGFGNPNLGDNFPSQNQFQNFGNLNQFLNNFRNNGEQEQPCEQCSFPNNGEQAFSIEINPQPAPQHQQVNGGPGQPGFGHRNPSNVQSIPQRPESPSNFNKKNPEASGQNRQQPNESQDNLRNPNPNSERWYSNNNNPDGQNQPNNNAWEHQNRPSAPEPDNGWHNPSNSGNHQNANKNIQDPGQPGFGHWNPSNVQSIPQHPESPSNFNKKNPAASGQNRQQPNESQDNFRHSNNNNPDGQNIPNNNAWEHQNRPSASAPEPDKDNVWHNPSNSGNYQNANKNIQDSTGPNNFPNQPNNPHNSFNNGHGRGPEVIEAIINHGPSTEIPYEQDKHIKRTDPPIDVRHPESGKNRPQPNQSQDNFPNPNPNSKSRFSNNNNPEGQNLPNNNAWEHQKNRPSAPEPDNSGWHKSNSGNHQNANTNIQDPGTNNFPNQLNNPDIIFNNGHGHDPEVIKPIINYAPNTDTPNEQDKHMQTTDPPIDVRLNLKHKKTTMRTEN